ncbi:DUF4160 domain-containing protein [Candidatus Ozemobacteraceae bacterium]|nr:DUF4160 domain-containing protein [Candidatus Ozemobacteraceae bacterium]
MPTVLMIYGWRFFFYANERNEPIHIHCKSGDKECKYWLDCDDFDAIEAYSYNMSPSDKRLVKKLIFEYFELIENSWKEFQERKSL